MGFSIKEIFQEAYNTLEQRGKTYDPTSGQERSMEQIVEVFNALTGHELSVADGWVFMQTVKGVRQQTSPEFHKDSMIDKLSYVLLEAEERMKDCEPASGMTVGDSLIYHRGTGYKVYKDGSCSIQDPDFEQFLEENPHLLKTVSSPEEMCKLLECAHKSYIHHKEHDENEHFRHPAFVIYKDKRFQISDHEYQYFLDKHTNYLTYDWSKENISVMVSKFSSAYVDMYLKVGK